MILQDFGRELFAAIQTCGALVSAQRSEKSLNDLRCRLQRQRATLTDEEVSRLTTRYPWILDGGTPKPSLPITS